MPIKNKRADKLGPDEIILLSFDEQFNIILNNAWRKFWLRSNRQNNCS